VQDEPSWGKLLMGACGVKAARRAARRADGVLLAASPKRK